MRKVKEQERPTGNLSLPISVLQNMPDDASILTCLTTSRLIWLAVSIAFANAIRSLRGSLSSTSIPSSYGSPAPTCLAGSLRKTLPRRYF